MLKDRKNLLKYLEDQTELAEKYLIKYQKKLVCNNVIVDMANSSIKEVWLDVFENEEDAIHFDIQNGEVL